MTQAWARHFRGTSRFRPLGKIGEGGMGSVYAADDLERGERVAIKLLRRADPAAVRRFKQEYRALQDLAHPNLVRLGELHEVEGQWFFSMELVEGTDLTEYLRGPRDDQPLEETRKQRVSLPPLGAREPYARLRDAFRQLALGLSVLHASGKVHCDVKPANVRVTPQGRVVLLDFGLLLEDERRDEDFGHVAGTAAYMAPEQARDGDIGPATDWYAFGVVMYEALTGRLPFEGEQLQVLLDKTRLTPPRPAQLGVGIPEDLDALCMALLARDPEARPSGSEILALLGARERTPDSVSRPAFSSAHDVPFVGRKTERDLLHAAHADVQRGDAVVVSVEGASGLGKSTLIARFVEEARAERPDLVVLSGRCYERETTRFKALDGVVEALSLVLLGLSPEERRALIPPHAALLRQRFPALARVDVIGHAMATAHRVRDAVEERRLTFQALRELLARLSDRHPLILTIDDMQWADGDSVELLRALIDPSHEPPPRMLVAVSAREAWTNVASDGHGREKWPGSLRVLELGRLSDADAEALARAHLSRLGNGDVDTQALVREAAGHPMFVSELTRLAHQTTGEKQPDLTLDQAIWRRASALPEATLTVLALLSVAAVPLSPRVLSSTLAKSQADVDRDLVALRLGGFVKTVSGHGSRRIEPYHDRVREAVVGQLEATTRRSLHAVLAPALDAEPGVDPELVAQHYLDAGDKERASALFARAAQYAEEGLAFERAALLYRVQLELGRVDDRERGAMFQRLGAVLVRAGRARSAAEAYTAALPFAEPTERVSIQSIIASCLLRSGHVNEGLAALDDVLASVQLSIPRSESAALLSFAWQRTRLFFGGYQRPFRDPSTIEPEALRRADALFVASQGLSLIDGIRCAPIAAKAVSTALVSGERSRIVKALSAEVSTLSLAGKFTQRMTLRALSALRSAAEGTNDPLLTGYVLGAESTYANSHAFFQACYDKANEALSVFDAPGVEAQWERVYVRSFRIFAQFYLGRLREMFDEGEEALKDAQARRDRWFESLLRLGPCSLGRVNEDLNHARLLNEEGYRPWADRRPGFLFWCWFVKTVALDLTEGRWDLALARYEEHEKAVAQTGSWHVPMLRAHLCAYQAVALLGKYQAHRSPDSLKQAEKSLARMGSENQFMHGWEALLRAQIAEARGQVETQVAHAETAIRAFKGCDAERFLRMTEAYLGITLGGDRGRELAAGLDSYFAREKLESWDILVLPFIPALRA